MESGESIVSHGGEKIGKVREKEKPRLAREGEKFR
jgi:hypothetical protein